MADTEQHLVRYKLHLERNPSEERLLQILTKLSRLPVTIELLQSTGIGKTVNGFRKQEGDIGITAKALVRSWKTLVAEEANQVKDCENGSPQASNHMQDRNGEEIYQRQSHHRSHDERKQASQSKSSESRHHHRDAHKSSKHSNDMSRSSSHRSDGRGHKETHSRRGEKRSDHRQTSHRHIQPESPRRESYSDDQNEPDSDFAEEDEDDLPEIEGADYLDSDGNDSEEMEEKESSAEESESDDTSRKRYPQHEDAGTRKSSSRDNVRSHDGGSRQKSSTDSHHSQREEGRKSSSRHNHKVREEDNSRKSSSKISPHKSSSNGRVSANSSSNNEPEDRRHRSKSSSKSNSSRSSSSKSSSKGRDETFSMLFSPDEIVSSEKKRKPSSDHYHNMEEVESVMDTSESQLKSETEKTRKAVKRSADCTDGRGASSRKMAKKESAVKVEADPGSEEENNGLSFEDMLSYDQATVKKTLKKKKENVCESIKLVGESQKITSSRSQSEQFHSDSKGRHSSHSHSDSSHSHSSKSHSHTEKSHSHSSKSHSHTEKSHSHSSKSHSHTEKSRPDSSKSHSHTSKSHSHTSKSHSHSSTADFNSGKSHSHSSKSSSSSEKSESKVSSSKHSGKSKRQSSSDSHSKHSASGKSRHSEGKTGSTSKGGSSDPGDVVSSLKIPSAPKQEIRLTDSDIMGYLPETQAYYKPLRLQDEDQRDRHKKNAIDPMLIGSKSYSRTQVYSGRKNTGISEMVPLFELCMRVLMDNIDSLDYVGGVPYDILKPVLEKCSAEQLYRLEDCNPQFLTDTGDLWRIHCNRDFRGAKPDEMESWRELYLRRYDEREAKLQKLKANIAASEEARKAPVRHTKLAYVDTVAKPPRDVRRKQMKYGTATIDSNPSSSRPNPAGYQRSSLKSRLAMDTAPVAPRRAVKVAAPMMQKTMKMIKKLHVRR